jgi:hypothetical protein
MADQMVAEGQREALKGMEKMIPMGRVAARNEIAVSLDGGFIMR